MGKIGWVVLGVILFVTGASVSRAIMVGGSTQMLTNIPLAPASLPDAAVSLAELLAGPSRGLQNARMAVTLFADFQCPASKKMADMLKQLQQDDPQALRVVFKHYPRPHLSQSSVAAVSAAAAHLQGRFWAYHDALLGRQASLGDATFRELAHDVGLDSARFAADRGSGTANDIVDKDIALADSLGVRRVPTLIIGGRMLVGAVPIWELAKIIGKSP